MFSYWEKTTFIGSPDVIIIGSGIVGLSSAIALKEKNPALHILILERGMLPYGASTRNAGFACYGSPSELLSDLETHSASAVFSLVEDRWKGLQQLRKRIGDAAMEYEPFGGYEVFSSTDEQLYESCCKHLDTFNSYLKDITGIEKVYRFADEEIKSFGFNQVSHLILNSGEGQINTGKMMQSLLQLANEKGVVVLNGATVDAIEANEHTVNVHLNGSVLKAKKVLIATNGFSKKFLPHEDVQAARAQVLITNPIPQLKVKGSFHYDHGYYYFRNVGDRILFGGGRNLNFEKEFTEQFDLTEEVQNRLDHLLKTMILPDCDYSIDMRWSGIMGLGNEKKPIIKEVSPNIFCAIRMGGMGVAIGSLVGEQAAELISLKV